MFFKNSGHAILAPLSGQIIAISDVDEILFSGKVVGDGVAIKPSLNENNTVSEILAPISGVVSFIGEQKHTFGITGFDGIEVLIHVGINTVKLNGLGFNCLVKKGEKIESGQVLGTVDFKVLQEHKLDLTTPLIITSSSMDKVKRLTIYTGESEAGKTIAMRYTAQD